MSDTNPTDREKKVILRSAAYPSITIEEAVNFVTQIKKNFPNSQFTREDVSAVLEKATIHRDVAASVQYGLLVKTIGEGYKLSPRVNQILNFISEDEKNTALIECFKTPKLYLDLYEKYKNHAIPPESQFRNILTRFHNITEVAAPQVAEIFVQNAIHVKLLTLNRVLRENYIVDEENPKPVIIDGMEHLTMEASTLHANTKEPSQQSALKAPLLLQEMNSSTEIKINLTEKKFAYLIHPEKLNEKDIQILKLQLDMIALALG